MNNRLYVLYTFYIIGCVALASCGRIREEEPDPNTFVVNDEIHNGLTSLLNRAVVTEAHKCPTSDLVACAEMVKQNLAKYVQEHPEVQTIQVPARSARNYVTNSYPYPVGPYGPWQINHFYTPYNYGAGVVGGGCTAYGCGAAGAQQDYYGGGVGFLYSGAGGYAGLGIKCSILIGGCVGVAGANGYGAAGYCGAFGCGGVTW